ncbi:alcohol dehydrogenase catalytic domain-containing protein [Pelomonas sp. P7]|uniref:Alcohol dehydrogenase catalytic domain-containing protein n=1 Tax=Pelomonas caseinilytica TaxID=2906763 RepID=A0ABS8X9A4_9BURK|nr:alcohol dehydrogenase catalytic domain-containing protein [Pelomonas sp. P7]MCE4535690.1 alcohol dehydrogenase catalytic domain-containing protein [Pelomonas sp. P7]
MRRELVCLRPSVPAALQVRQTPLPEPGHGEVRVRVQATSVNPIDARRASGYGQRLLSLKGAGRFPLVLGNDLVGHVQALGAGATGFAVGERVFGLVGTGRRGGAHASHVVVPEAWLRPAPAGMAAAALAVLPYAFTTMWQAVRAAGLHPGNAAGRKVLVLGAAGALGRLSLQLLSSWGCSVTAVASAGSAAECQALGASMALERGPAVLGQLPDDFDVALNFASWDEDIALASRLGTTALGQATTVHPLLGHFDRLGWLKGALACQHDKQQVQAVVRQRCPTARYAWTIFKPDAQALDELATRVAATRISLPVGLCTGLEQADSAFAHVAAGRPGRAVLIP